MNIRDYFNNFGNADFTDSIIQTPLQYGYINSLNLFNVKPTNQLAVIFDKETSTTTLLPQVIRGTNAATQGKERQADTFSLRLAYFKHADQLTAGDIQGWRQIGSTDDETIARATAEKMVDIRRAIDQTNEYMKLQALKGIFKTPDGQVMANMFTEFGVTQNTVDFALGTATTNVDQKLRLLKSGIAKNVMNGGAIGGVEVLVDPVFFDKLISHPNMKNAYQYYTNSGKQLLRDDLSSYMEYGITDTFEFRGVNFVSYDASFNLPNGTTEVAFADSTGTAFAKGVKDLFRGYHGPSAKMSDANQPGQELYMRTYVHDRDEYVDFEAEMAPLYFGTKPASLWSVSSSN